MSRWYPALISCFLVASSCTQSEQPNFPPRSAGCLVLTDYGILAVKDYWSKSWGVPAGFLLSSDEEYRRGAERESLEETGFTFVAGTEVFRENNFRMFSCKPENGQLAVTFLGSPPHIRLPQFANKEIQRAALLKIDSKEFVEGWRFTSQIEKIKRFVSDHSSEVATIVPKQAPEMHPLVAIQIDAIKKMQTLGPAFEAVLEMTNFFGETIFFFLVLPIFLVGPLRSFGLRLCWLIIASTLVNIILKNSFCWPRPIDFVYEIGLKPASDFGFPSGHTQIAATFFLTLGLRWKKFLVPAILLSMLTGAARVYFGVHFFHDIAFGWVVGALFAVAGHYLFKDKESLVVFILLPLALWFAFRPLGVSSGSAAVGMLLGIWLFSSKDMSQQPRMSYYIQVILGAAGLILLAKFVPKLVSLIPIHPSSFIGSFLKTSLRYGAVGLWFAVQGPLLSKLLNSSRP